MYLAIDIGGTKVTVASYEMSRGQLKQYSKERFASRDFGALEAILADYVGRMGNRFQSVAIGAAGPVVGRTSKITNLPWSIDADALQGELGVPVALMNDLVAHGHGVSLLAPENVVTLNAGKPRAANAALIAAGTGLGEAILFWDGSRYQPSSSEGGHSDFGPRNEEEIELLRFLMQRYTHVSWERVVSGLDGFRNLYDFLLDSERIRVPDGHRAKLAEGDIGAEITTAAAAGEEYARTVVTWFVRLYGAEAGNLALKCLAHGGVYVSGGIAARIMPALKSGVFMEAFSAKGRFKALLEDMPVYVVLDEDLALKGAAVVAMGLVD